MWKRKDDTLSSIAKPDDISTKVALEIDEVSCADCAMKLEQSINKIPGIRSFSLEVLSGKATADLDPGLVDEKALIKAIMKNGYKSRKSGSEVEEPARGFLSKNRFALLTALSGSFWLTALISSFTSFSASVHTSFYLLGILFAFAAMSRQIFASIRTFSFDMNLLMTGAVAGAIFLGEWAEGGMVIFLFALSEMIESYSMGKANRAIESLMDLAPDQVRLLENNVQENVSPQEVPVGSIFQVRPGERIGLDGVVASGTSSVDQSAVNGESLPVHKSPGEEVNAGTINKDGVLNIRSTRLASDSTVARIIKLVRQAQEAKAPTQRFIESFSKVYTPIVFVIAVLVTVIPVLGFGQAFSVWFYRSLVMLLIACPCAFVIATPVTIVSGLTVAARLGILLKGGVAMEKAAKIKAVAFDKTGTLTMGKPEVTQIFTLNNHDEKQLLSISAGIGEQSGHVLGEAIVRYAKKTGSRPIPATDVRALPGLGAIGIIDGEEVFLGSHRFFHEQNLCNEAMHTIAEKLESKANILVFVGTRDKPVGIIALSDSVRPDVKTTLAKLRSGGIESLTILTGDTVAMSKKIAGPLGITDVRAGLMPEQKVEVLSELKEKYNHVAMVGDGINDAPALATSDLGVAMGAGADQALETADAALVSDRLDRLSTLFDISRKTVRRIKINVGIALGIKALFFALAVFGWATLWMAVFADTGASIIVIASGVSLLRYKKKNPSD